jgi:hypothetical protein
MTVALTPALAYIAALAATLVVATVMGGAPVPPLTVIAAALLAVAIPLLLARVHPAREGLVWQVSWLVVLGVVLSLAWFGALPERPYGDGAILAQFVAAGEPMPRWLAGSALAAWGYAAVWELPPVAVRLSAALATAMGYLSVLCASAMVLGTVLLLRRWPTHLAVLLPTLTPVWLLFSSGYVEYYPLIAPLFVAALAWLSEKPLEQRPPLPIGVLAGALPCVYVAFVPVAAIVLVSYALVRRAQALGAVTAALITGTALVAICWPAGGAHYFRALYGVMNFGASALPPRYEGMVAGSASIFFGLPSALTPMHLGDVLYMYGWAGGWWGPLLLLLVACVARPRLASGRLVASLVVWQAAYLGLMVPRLGPTSDVDLFFATYLTVAFAAGALLDGAPALVTPARRRALVAGVLGASVGTALYLAWLGIPVRM